MKNFSRNLLAILLVVFTVNTSFSASAPKREFRSTWMATVWGLDWPSTTGVSASVQATQKAQMDRLIQGLADNGFTSVCFQVRSMCDAMYKSSYEPWSSFLTGTRGADPGWDPLAYAVEKCHSLGLECHAWINPFRWSTGSAWNTPQDQEVQNNGWILTGSNGTYKVLNPAIPEVRKRVVDICKEIITNYKVDGFLFDDYFYPSGGTNENSSAEDYTQWKNSGTTMSIADWRRNNVRISVKQIYDMVQEVRPDCRFGIGPAGVAGTASTSASKYGVTPCPTGSDWQYDQIYCDPLAWLYDGTIDYISPQLYWNTNHATNPFGPLTDWWSYCANNFGRHHYASQSISALGSANNQTNWAEYKKQIDLSRQYTENNAPGCVFYSTAYINGDKVSGFGNYLQTNVFTNKSLTPVVSWKTKKNYSAPTKISKNNSNLNWDAVSDGNRIIRYTVYAIPSSVKKADAMASDGDGIKAEYLQGVTYSNSYTLKSNVSNGYWYAICVYDGFGNESEAGMYGNEEIPSEIATLIAPINNAVTAWTQEFSWSNLSNATYKLEISGKSDFTNIVITKSDLTSNNVTVDLTSLADNTAYFWRIISRQTGKLESTSSTGAFTTGTKPVAPSTTLISPANGTQFEDDITFTWSKANVDSYRLQVSSSEDFSNIITAKDVITTSSGDVSTTVSVSQIGKGTFYWRVISISAGMNDGYSNVRSFLVTKLPTGNFEPGYSIKKDNSTYSRVNNIECENLWMRSIKDGFANITFDNFGLLNRGMCASGDFVYVVGRSDNSQSANVYLQKYDANTGEHISDIIVNGASNISYYPGNDVIKDSNGNICITNLSLNIGTAPLKIFQVNTETGESTLRAECSLTGLSTTRVDHAAIYGNVANGNFYVFAAVAKSNIVIRWSFVNGSLSKAEKCTLSGFYPSSVANTGIAPVIIPINETEFFLDGGDSSLCRYNFSTGAMTDSFSNNADLSPSSFEANGAKSFVLNGKNYLIYAYGDYSASNGYNFNLVNSDNSLSIKSMQKYWSLPEQGIGNYNSQTWQADADFLTIDNKSGKLFIYIPGNGLAAYKLTDYNGSGVSSITDNSGVNIYSFNNTIYFSEMVEMIEIFSTNGQIVGKYENLSELTLDVIPGIYIVKVLHNGEIKCKPIVIK